jgi:potassium-transporting ATPase ATP-binding subunit
VFVDGTIDVPTLVALLVCLIPTTIGGLLGRDRHRRHGPADPSQRDGHVGPRGGGGGRRRRAAARQDRARSRSATGRRRVLPAPGVAEQELADAAQLASLADETPEGRSIVVLAKEKFGLRGRPWRNWGPSSCRSRAQSRMSG